MTTEPGELDDAELLKRSAHLRHAASHGERQARGLACEHEMEVRRRFTGYVPTDHGVLPKRSAHDYSLWSRFKQWLSGA